jgi:hypothetical protein
MTFRSREHWSHDVDEVIRSKHYTWLGLGLGGDAVDEAMVDILTDIRHICKREGLAWESMLVKSRAQFEREEQQKAESAATC